MKRERIRSFWNKPSHAAYLFIAPAGILLFVFCIIPLMASLVISTFKMGVDFHSADFIAFDNYHKQLYQKSRKCQLFCIYFSVSVQNSISP